MLYWGFRGLPTEVVKFSEANLTEDSINRPAMVLLWFAWWAVGLVGAGLAALILRSKATPVAVPEKSGLARFGSENHNARNIPLEPGS